jgi:hypothetical protein
MAPASETQLPHKFPLVTPAHSPVHSLGRSTQLCPLDAHYCPFEITLYSTCHSHSAKNAPSKPQTTTLSVPPLLFPIFRARTSALARLSRGPLPSLTKPYSKPSPNSRRSRVRVQAQVPARYPSPRTGMSTTIAPSGPIPLSTLEAPTQTAPRLQRGTVQAFRPGKGLRRAIPLSTLWWVGRLCSTTLLTKRL